MVQSNVRPVPGLSPRRIALGNGAVFIGKHARATPAVTINLAMRAGSMYDPAEGVGATWLLSRVIDRGTASRSTADIAADLDARGVTVTVSVTLHILSLVCTCLAEDFEPVFSLLGEMLMRPSLPEHEIVTCKGEVITAIRQDQDNPAARSTELLMALLYPGSHPYGRPTKGAIDAVESLTREQLVRLHTARFAPGELTAVVVGDVEVSRAQDLVARVFGEWRAPRPPPIALAAPAPASDRRRLVIPMMNKAQADIAYGFTAIRRADPAWEALRLMTNILGQYALGGRLGDSIRERQGMAYYVSSAVDPDVVEGPLVIRAGVSAVNVDRAVDAIDGELTRLVADGITARELDESRQYLIGAMPCMLETNAGIASFLQTAEFFDLGVDYDLRMPDLLRHVTQDEVHAVVCRIIDPARAALVIAGPCQEH